METRIINIYFKNRVEPLTAVVTAEVTIRFEEFIKSAKAHSYVLVDYRNENIRHVVFADHIQYLTIS